MTFTDTDEINEPWLSLLGDGETATQTLLDAALDYAKRGWRVFPLNGKVPRTSNGFYDATTDPNTIRNWWETWPEANVGIATGLLVVLDVDARYEGLEALRDLEDENTKLPDTLTALSGGGGKHLYFSTDKPLRGRKLVGNGVELKAEGGYVVAPPSIHPDTGETYVWEDETVSIAELPDWLWQLTQEQTGNRKPLDVGAIFDGVPEGQRNDTLFRLACKMRGEGYPSDVASESIAIAASRCDPPYPDGDARQIVKSAYDRYPAGSWCGSEELVWQISPNTHSNSSTNTVGLIKGSDITPTKTNWLWPGRIPLGKLTFLEGDPSLGKSTLLLDIAARLTTGREMPDGSQADVDGPVSVMLWSAEDGADDTIIPRFEVAGGNKDLLWVLDNQNPVFIPDDIPDITRRIQELGIRLFIIDPLFSYLSAKIKVREDKSVRTALTPLAAMAQQTGCSVIMLRHISKNSGETNPLYRGVDSIGFTAAARSVLLVAPNPSSADKSTVVLAQSKSSLSRKAPSLEYHLDESYVAAIDGKVGRVVWDGETETDAASLLAAVVPGPKVSKVEEAEEFLKRFLADGGRRMDDVLLAAKGYGIADDTLKKAKRRLNCTSTPRQDGSDKYYEVALPTPPQ